MNTEKDEINRLNDTGIEFTIKQTKRVRTARKRSIFERLKVWLGIEEEETIEREVKTTYSVKEPTLAVLDLLSAEFISLEIEEEEIKAGGNRTLAAAKRMLNAHAYTCARIAAIATMGERCFIQDEYGIYETDEKAIRERTAVFYHAITPENLISLTNLITGACDLGNFISSIILLSASRTTTPAKIIE